MAQVNCKQGALDVREGKLHLEGGNRYNLTEIPRAFLEFTVP